DIDWIRDHTRISGLALRWDAEGRPKRLLPRGQEVEKLEEWRDSRPTGAPEVLPLQAAYLAAARSASAQRQRAWFVGGAVTVALVSALAIFAYFQALEADEQRVVAENYAVEAENQRDQAEEERAAAVVAREQAETERNAALLNQSRFLAGLSDQMLEEGRAREALALAYQALPHDRTSPERPFSATAFRSLRHARHALREMAELEGQERIGIARYSPNGLGLATGDLQGQVFVRDAQSGEPLLEFDAHPPGFVSMAFGANSGFLLTAGADWTPRLWGMDGNKISDIFGMQGIVTAVAVSEDMSRVAAADFEGRVHMWDTATGNGIGPLASMAGGVGRLEFSKDSKVLVANSRGDDLQIWSAEDGAEIAYLNGADGRITTFALRPYGSELALGRENGDIELRSTRDGSLQAKVTGQHGAAITHLVYSPDGWTIGSTDLLASYAVLTRAEVGTPLFALLGHNERLVDIAFSHDSAYVLTGAFEGAARLWDAERGQTIALLGGHREGVSSVGFNPVGESAFTISGDGTVRLWSTANAQVGQVYDGSDWNTVATALGENSEALVVWRNKAARLNQDAESSAVFEHNLEAEIAAISAENTHFAVADEAGTVALFSFEDGSEVARTTLPDSVQMLRFAPDAGGLLIGLISGRLLRWVWASGRIETIYEGEGLVADVAVDGERLGILSAGGYTVLGPEGEVETQSVAKAGVTFVGSVSPDLSKYAKMETAGEVSVRAPNGDELNVLRTPYKSFRLIRFSDDGSMIFVGGGSGGVSAFDASSARLIAELHGHLDGVSSVALRDGELLSGDTGGQVRRRPLFLEPWQAIEETAEILETLPPLSPEERCGFFLAAAEDC
ncbi:MAG: hypothetical protein AAGC81_09000, partial [Pseudomonadota bacterium]